MMSKKWVKIIVPFCILLVIAGIWVFKNMTGKQKNRDLPQSVKSFDLHADSIDLEELTSYGLPIIIDFGADSCEPCKEMAPILDKLNQELRGKAIIKFVDVWKNGEAARGFPIQLIPTQVFLNADGSPYVPNDNIEIAFTLYETRDSGEHVYTVHQGKLTEDQMLSILYDMGVER